MEWKFRWFLIDYGCPAGHDMQCFNDSGHKDATGPFHWNEKVNNPFLSRGCFPPGVFFTGIGDIDWAWAPNDVVQSK